MTSDRLAFIRHARDLGFPLQAIRDLLGMSDRPDLPCAAVDGIAKTQLAAVEGRIARLMALKSELERMIAQCAGGCVADCRVIECLGNHAHCTTEHGREPAEVSELPRCRRSDFTSLRHWLKLSGALPCGLGCGLNVRPGGLFRG